MDMPSAGRSVFEQIEQHLPPDFSLVHPYSACEVYAVADKIASALATGDIYPQFKALDGVALAGDSKCYRIIRNNPLHRIW
ncbi:hypothetical protein [Pelagibacterium sp. H642]|uniref:hypothetical protein n=1 Tax=Pelagibacterium sp. H642 TaxID=1881069 RepID=UPI00281574EE|nr:hypothetical protein [Pelagibacterium sp. H642]WMT92629.1 hypothetical protein NO934_19995 [Pelagibacterium sp. H642]